LADADIYFQLKSDVPIGIIGANILVTRKDQPNETLPDFFTQKKHIGISLLMVTKYA